MRYEHTQSLERCKIQIGLKCMFPNTETFTHNIRSIIMSTSNVNMNEVEETLARIKSHKGVEGIVIMTKEGEYLPRYFLQNISFCDQIQFTFLKENNTELISALKLVETLFL
jgi:hypothetical protein